MKGLIVTLLFLSSFVSNVFGNQTRLDLLKANIPEIKLNNEFQGTVDINNYAQKNYIKRPIGEVNLFLGDYVTGFKIDLPKSFHSFHSLSFEYNSSRVQNNGFGIGFFLELPKLIIKKDSLKIAGKNNGELIELKAANNLAESRIDHLIKKLNLNNPKIVKFLNVDGNDTSLYLKLESLDKIFYGQIKTNNETSLFDQDGNVLSIFNRTNQGIDFQYKDGLLISGLDHESKFNFEINYQLSSKELVFRNHKFLPKVMGIVDLKINQGNLSKTFKFLYDQEYLKQVYEVGSNYNIFAAVYSDVESSVAGFKQVAANYQPTKDAVLGYFSKDLNARPAFKKLADEDYSYLVDLNNDLVLDKVTINLKEKINRANEIFKKLNFVNSSNSNYYKLNRTIQDIESDINNFVERVDVYLGSLDSSGNVSFRKDDSLSNIKLQKNTLDFSLTESTEKRSQTVGRGEGQYEIEYYVQTFEVKTKYNNVFKFIDLDNNGKKDILLCASNDDLESLELSLSGRYKDFKQNLISKYYHDLLIDRGSVINVKNDQAENAIYFYDNKEKIISLGLISKNEESLENNLLNTSFFEVQKLIRPITCNQGSIVLDANNDGQYDLLTGKTLTLLGYNSESLNQDLSSDEFKAFFEAPARDLKIDQYPVELLELKNNKFSFIEGFGSIVDRVDRSLVVARVESELKFFRPPPVKVLTKEFSRYSGSVEVKYLYHKGSALVQEKILNNGILKSDADIEDSLLKGKRIKKVYSYQGSKIDERTNILLGHHAVFVTSFEEDLSGIMQKKATVKNYFNRDMNTHSLFYMLRARNLGQISKLEKFSSDSKLLSYTNFSYKDYLLTLNNRSMTTLSKKESYVQGASKEAIKENYNFSGLTEGLLYLNIEKIQSRTKKTQKNQFNPSAYTVCSLFEGTYSLLTGEIISPEINYGCDQQGSIIFENTAEKKLRYTYDSLGRLLVKKDNHGAEDLYEYYDSSPLVKTFKANDKEQYFDYEFVSNRLISFKENQGPLLTYKWTNDDLKSIYRNETEIFSQNFNGNLVSLNVADEKLELVLDGFGELLKQTKVLSSGDDVVQKYQVLDAEGKVLKSLVHNDLTSDVVNIVYSYDELGRLIQEDESGGYAKIYNRKTNVDYVDAGMVTTEMLTGRSREQLTKKTFKEYNELGELASMISGSLKGASEKVDFKLNEAGKVTGVYESLSGFTSQFSYDESGRFKSSSADELYSWGNLKSDYLNLGKLVVSTNGKKELDIYERLSFSTNFSLQSNFQEKFTYSKGNLVKNEQILGSLRVESRFEYLENELSLVEIFNQEQSLLKKEISYDKLGRIKNEQVDLRSHQLNMNFEFADGFLTSLSPFISEFIYSDSGKLNSVTFANGSSLDLSVDHHGRLMMNQLRSTSGEVFGIVMNEGLDYSSKLYTNKNFYNLKSKNLVFNYADNLTLQKRPMYHGISKVNKMGSFVESANDFRFTKENDMTSVIKHPSYGEVSQYYDADKSWRGSCLKVKGQCQLNNLFYKISPTEFYSHGSYIRAIKVQNHLVGVLVNDVFYPALVDQVGSLIALLSEDGKKILFEREYSDWGEKLNVWGDKELERKIPFAFAGLIQHPYFNGEILQSETRIYLPSVGIWQEADNLVKWNPNSLLNAPGNWNPMVYAANDPVNFVDPSGRNAIWAIGGTAMFSGILYSKFNRHISNINYIDNYMEQLYPLAHSVQKGNQDLLTAYRRLEQLRNVTHLNFAKDISKDVYGNYIPKPDKVSFFESVFDGIMEFFNDKNSKKIRNEADSIIDAVLDDLPRGSEIKLQKNKQD